MKKTLHAGFICLLALLLCFSAFAADSGNVDSEHPPLSGSGTAADPWLYQFGDNDKVTWKHLEDLRASGETDRYEKRENDAPSERLQYYWTISGGDLTEAVGPYFLAVHFYGGEFTKQLPGGDGAFYFSLATKRDFPGPVTLGINVSSDFQDGTVLRLCYYGGYDATIYHSAVPVLPENEILQQDEMKVISETMTVAGGFITARLRYGGNYFLAPVAAKPASPSPSVIPASSSPSLSPSVKPSASAPSTSPQQESTASDAAPEAPLGAIGVLFPEAAVADEIARKLSKTTADTITQGDLDGIQSLYLDNAGLTDLKSLAAQGFAHLTALSLSGNALTAVPELRMPLLNWLDLSGNAIADLDGLNTLKGLMNLNLSSNKLTAIPDVTSLTNLRTLDLCYNMIDYAGSLALPNLMYLNLSGNRLLTLPDLSGCEALSESEFWEQSGTYSLKLTDGASSPFESFPSIIRVLSGEPKVMLTDENGAALAAPAYGELEKAGIDPNALGLKPGGSYRMTIRGTINGKVIGAYAYSITVSGGGPTDTTGVAADHAGTLTLLIVIVALAATGIITFVIIIRRKRGFRT
jgi:hypothetical protein